MTLQCGQNNKYVYPSYEERNKSRNGKSIFSLGGKHEGTKYVVPLYNQSLAMIT